MNPELVACVIYKLISNNKLERCKFSRKLDVLTGYIETPSYFYIQTPKFACSHFIFRGLQISFHISHYHFQSTVPLKSELPKMFTGHSRKKKATKHTMVKQYKNTEAGEFTVKCLYCFASLPVFFRLREQRRIQVLSYYLRFSEQEFITDHKQIRICIDCIEDWNLWNTPTFASNSSLKILKEFLLEHRTAFINFLSLKCI